MSPQPAATVHFRHNTDLDPGEDYLTAFPRLKTVLANPTAVATFREYDDLANARQSLLWRIGVTSLLLGGVGLLGTATKLMLVALGHGHEAPQTWWTDPLTLLGVGSEVLVLAAILLVLPPWYARTRRA